MRDVVQVRKIELSYKKRRTAACEVNNCSSIQAYPTCARGMIES